ncbi:flagellar biosynthetic protein FliO [Stutzerimonas nitrititolerans]|uniref:Flagellar protein n=1 Tax=Stutzerimonas nitrititolerans TaxID=2482751 RepID=A0AA41WQT5_9GAMM|nr:flagellar biosynthetic protein FliO [Stutzerimonas nitrititolerans]KRW73934.1 flagellar assembly protein FliO [Pseudomonas sp. TTU2014-066ASC]MBA1185148.1 flagellar biosynthetic protein FliO [Stutzerimonas stutzeri]OCX19266.1 flagellar biosynthetic protein FliO [Stutzerimonas xanthomarina]RRV24732.1 flagellar biosynthetic protein FliO [Pseudomonas sp. s199]WAD27938.1 flagellar biosynthetic protein FliO [Pseudomonadaceae bacterium T75]HAQ27901.1 flagellar biosynthetic protein FliO [Pseudomo
MRILAALAMLPMLPVMAAETTASMSSAGMGAQLSKLLLGLLLVIGLIFLLAWLLRRVQQLHPRGAQVIKIVSTQALGPRERLVLVQVGGEQILLGLSAGRITPLHVLEEPVHLPDAEPATPEFAQRLMELLGKDQKDKH